MRLSTCVTVSVARGPNVARITVSPGARRGQCSTQSTRREAILALIAPAVSTVYTASALPTEYANTDSIADSSDSVVSSFERDPTFYATWPYARPADIVPFIKQQAAAGDHQAILDAMDAFSQYYPQYKIGPEKGALLEQVLKQNQPRLALEVGTFLGYSAIRTARCLSPGGHLICVEANPDNAAVARELIAYAGMGDRVTVVTGVSGQVIPTLPALMQPSSQQQQQVQQEQPGADQVVQQHSFDVVFLDHCKDCYKPDLQALEELHLIHPGSVVLADNVLYPGAPGYLEYLDSSGLYDTRLLKAKYEYEQAWNPNWEPNKQDALAVAVYVQQVVG